MSVQNRDRGRKIASHFSTILYFITQGIRGQIKPKVRRKEIKIREKINEIEIRITAKKNNEIKKCFSGKINI